ncbi:dihydrolipoyl dehydrogenase [Thalassobacillus devorans]|uniref:Dihydrolipoyl dehydrogenase n=1 Tax=Thalassobacillus devorans TaxID=279813 RepID=A0ABQ1PR17_9BACI|nr:dihydrolipoyl dehydrogenase [Thalassobacillus devorans]NIK30570.1 dihydrolipoamide dehydrogenase [Thalassobacillus devorans]GGD01845.1 dihydrolipoyl dehydrogenase [Thalassobacillus devorans]
MLNTDVLIIGAGPGGYVAALRAAQLGMKVTLVEKEKLGGTCLNVGCIPSKALIQASHYAAISHKAAAAGVHYPEAKVNFAELQTWKNNIVRQLTDGVAGLLHHRNVNVIQGEAAFLDPHSVAISGPEEMVVTFDSCIIATGSKPVNVPGFPFGERILSSEGVLSLNEKPSSLAVIGGGYIGIELGTMFANFGTKVTILEGLPSILSGFSPEMSTLVQEELNGRENVAIHTEAKVSTVENSNDGVVVNFNVGDKSKEISADYALVTVGRKPNTEALGLEKAGIIVTEKGFIPIDSTCRTNQHHIFAIGDVTSGQALAHRASLQGKIAAETIIGDMVDLSDYVIPAVVFSDPPLAVVGPSKEELTTSGVTVNVHHFPFSHNGRSLTMNSGKGFVKLLVDSLDQTILSAEVAGEGAPELINELAVAIQSGLTAEDVSLVVHAHPTLGESIMEAADKAIGFPVHSL